MYCLVIDEDEHFGKLYSLSMNELVLQRYCATPLERGSYTFGHLTLERTLGPKLQSI